MGKRKKEKFDYKTIFINTTGKSKTVNEIKKKIEKKSDSSDTQTLKSSPKNENRVQHKSGMSKNTSKLDSIPDNEIKEKVEVIQKRKISHPRFLPGGEKHQIRLLPQPKPSAKTDLQKTEETLMVISQFKCNFCDFATTRINVLILHTKNCPIINNLKITKQVKS